MNSGIRRNKGFGKKRSRGQAQRHGNAERAKDFRGTSRRLLFYLKPQLPKLAVVFCFALASTIFTVKAPKLVGDSTNILTDGFISKSTVNSTEKIQKKIDPPVKSIIQKLEAGRENTVRQVGTAVEKKFAEEVSTSKQKAYGEAEKKAGAAVEAKFRETLSASSQQAYSKAAKAADAAAKNRFQKALAAKKQQIYSTAVKKADDAAEKVFNETVSKQKNEAYLNAEKAVEKRFAAIPVTPEASAAKRTATKQADDAVDAQFAKQQPALQAKFNAAKKQAEQQARAAVDAQFAKQQPALQVKLNAAKKQAEQQARAAVDAQFAKQQPELQKKLNSVKKDAEAKAKSTFSQEALKKAGLTQAEFQALKDVVAVPYVSTLKSNDLKANAVQKLFSLSKKLPAEYLKKVPSISQSDFDRGVNDVRKYGGAIPFAALWDSLMRLLIVFALSALTTFAMQYIMSDVAQKTVSVLRQQVDEKLSRLPLSYFDSHANGDILSRMTNDIDTISSTLQQSLTQIITSLFQIIGYIWMMVSINIVLTLIVLATLPLYLLATMFITNHSQKYYSAQQKHLGALSGHTEEMFMGHTVVKAFGHEKQSVKTFRGINDKLYESGWRAQFYSGIMMPLMNFIGNIGYVLIAVIGGIFVTKQYLNLGDIVSFVAYSKSFSQPIIMTANIANVIQSTVACAERVFELLDEKEQEPDAENATVLKNPQGNIRFDHVSFRYKENVPLIENMNLDVRNGDTIAIVGPTGAGKTTLVNLLMRFYEICGGSLTFDGVDIRKIRRGSLRTMFGMVLQDTWLFNGTIRENIAYGREGATDDEIVEAAKAAHADRFIRSLPDGYNTELNEDASNISQGQKQLLTIARAILADPVVLILDEATSSVDTRTEVLIQKAMAALMKGRTNFVIAHRLSTIRDAKTILVMNHGAIVEKGNHESLMAKNGFYADLYNSQFAGKET